MSEYLEDNYTEFGIINGWQDVRIRDQIITKRGTKIEMIERPKWGLACYMDNSIQSCEIDESIYHEALVHPVMMSAKNKKRVMIIGGGEGATAREVLKWSEVEHIDMYEWDEEVVSLFKHKYPQWASGAWDDNRLHIHFADIFEAIKTPPSYTNKYDIIIIDLFDPDRGNLYKWNILLQSLTHWVNSDASIVMYAGMRNILVKEQSYTILTSMLKKYNAKLSVIPYRVFIPSFSGESMFLLAKLNDTQFTDFTQTDFYKVSSLESHLNKDIWNSYKIFNW